MTAPRGRSTAPARLDDRLHVAHLTNELRWNGTGHTNSSVELAMEQAASGHRVSMICDTSDERMRALMRAHGLELHEGYSCTGWTGLLASARRARTLLRGADVAHVHTVRTTALLALASPVAFWRRSVSTLHNPHQRSAVLMATTRRVVALNERDRRTLHRSSLGTKRVTTIGNGMIGGRRLPAAGLVVPAELPPQTVVFTGALHERKGLDVLLLAMARVRRHVPHAQLRVVGNRDNPPLEQLARDLGFDPEEVFVGFADDPRVYMKAAALFVLPSRIEGFGNVLLEARSCHVPIIASDVGGIPEALSGTGELVPAGDVEVLAARITAVLTDTDLAARMSRGTQRDLGAWSVSAAARSYERVYRSLPGRRTGAW